MTDEMELVGTAAPPMANGEVVFEAPWQSRVFGMARVLCEQGHFQWDEFRDALISEIAQRDASSPLETYHYFDHFLAALNRVVEARKLVPEALVAQMEQQIRDRPHGHDH